MAKERFLISDFRNICPKWLPVSVRNEEWKKRLEIFCGYIVFPGPRIDYFWYGHMDLHTEPGHWIRCLELFPRDDSD